MLLGADLDDTVISPSVQCIAELSAYSVLPREHFRCVGVMSNAVGAHDSGHGVYMDTESGREPPGA